MLNRVIQHSLGKNELVKKSMSGGNRMIMYKNCSEATDDQIYEAFSKGFSDYMIKIVMEKDDMLERFFGPEGNEKELSCIALDGDRGVGLILGGIRVLNGIKTMRCGTMCIAPDYRGKGISQKLIDFHKEKGLQKGCKQMFLEVIVGNDRAIHFYEKNGYEKVYDLEYFNIPKVELTKMSVLPIEENYEIKQVGYYDVLSYRKELFDLHLPWQSDIEYYKSMKGRYYQAFDGDKIMAACGIYKGSLFFLHVKPEFRGLGIGMAVLFEVLKNESFESIRMTLANNAVMRSFCKHIGMKKNELMQYEMYLPL